MNLSTASLILAITAAAMAVIYFFVRRKASAAYWELQLSEGDAIAPAREAYWRADRAQKGSGLACVACYAATFAVLIAGQATRRLPQQPSLFSADTASIILASLAMMAVVLVASIYNGRDFEMRMKAETMRIEQESRRRREELARSSGKED